MQSVFQTLPPSVQGELLSLMCGWSYANGMRVAAGRVASLEDIHASFYLKLAWLANDVERGDYSNIPVLPVSKTKE